MSSGTFSNKSLMKKQYFKAVTDFNHGIENRMIYKVKFTREEECNAESCSSKEKYKWIKALFIEVFHSYYVPNFFH